MTKHWQFALRIGVAVAMTHFSVILFISMLYDVADKFTIMSRGDQQFTALCVALLGYACVRWIEYQVWQFILMFRQSRQVVTS